MVTTTVADSESKSGLIHAWEVVNRCYRRPFIVGRYEPVKHSDTVTLITIFAPIFLAGGKGGAGALNHWKDKIKLCN